jgi:hypothetical protein
VSVQMLVSLTLKYHSTRKNKAKNCLTSNVLKTLLISYSLTSYPLHSVSVMANIQTIFNIQKKAMLQDNANSRIPVSHDGK